MAIEQQELSSGLCEIVYKKKACSRKAKAELQLRVRKEIQTKLRVCTFHANKVQIFYRRYDKGFTVIK